MFDFTTTTVINSNKDYTTGLPLYSGQADGGEGKPANFHVKRVNKFLKPNVTGLFKAPATAPQKAKASFDLSTISPAPNAGDILRIHMVTRVSRGSVDADQHVDYPGKPFSFEFEWKDTADNTIKSLVKTYNKFINQTNGKKTVTLGGATSFLTIEAVDEYVRFTTLRIEKFDAKALNGMGEYKTILDFSDLDAKDTNAEVTDSAAGFFVGREGFGTYAYLLHNIRIPVMPRAFPIYADEQPVLGAMYNQYTIHYCVDRGPLGQNAVGDQVKSETVHVFYVKSDLVGDFETAIRNLGDLKEIKG